jgi:hypothetical protein
MGGYQESESQSQTRTGLRGTPYEGQAAEQAFKQGMLMSDFTNRMFSSPDALLGFGQQMLPGGRYGLGAPTDTAVEQLGRMMFSNASAGGAFRGQLSPENQTAVIGAAMQNMLPYLIPQIQQFQTAQFLAPQSLFNLARTSADYWNRALGAQSDTSSQSFGFNVLSNPVALSFGGGGGSSGAAAAAIPGGI